MLADRGTHVTYGALTFDPISVSPVDMIFRNIKVVGYWMTGSQSKTLDLNNKKAKITEAVHLIQKAGLVSPQTLVFDAKEWKAAFNKVIGGQSDSKVLLRFSEE